MRLSLICVACGGVLFGGCGEAGRASRGAKDTAHVDSHSSAGRWVYLVINCPNNASVAGMLVELSPGERATLDAIYAKGRFFADAACARMYLESVPGGAANRVGVEADAEALTGGLYQSIALADVATASVPAACDESLGDSFKGWNVYRLRGDRTGEWMLAVPGRNRVSGVGPLLSGARVFKGWDAVRAVLRENGGQSRLVFACRSDGGTAADLGGFALFDVSEIPDDVRERVSFTDGAPARAE